MPISDKTETFRLKHKTKITMFNEHIYSLPQQLRQPDITLGQFKRSLKTFMFMFG